MTTNPPKTVVVHVTAEYGACSAAVRAVLQCNKPRVMTLKDVISGVPRKWSAKTICEALARMTGRGDVEKIQAVQKSFEVVGFHQRRPGRPAVYGYRWAR